ncbi:hypothetical protein VN12_17900 [Pirellula sp. SH-Sr6A]|nr:hypothetical protein VN12_17900 [Pirellula sp. SH-Sr6A]
MPYFVCGLRPLPSISIRFPTSSRCVVAPWRETLGLTIAGTHLLGGRESGGEEEVSRNGAKLAARIDWSVFPSACLNHLVSWRESADPGFPLLLLFDSQPLPVAS